MITDEIFARIAWLLDSKDEAGGIRNLYMHETLVLICHEGTKQTQQSFGSLFAQVDYLCRKHNVSVADTIEIQTARRHSNNKEHVPVEEIPYDCRALAILSSAVFSCDVPSTLVGRIPVRGREKPEARHIDYREVKGIVESIGDTYIAISTTEGYKKTVNITAGNEYLRVTAREGMMLSIVDVHEEENGSLTPRFTIVEPDYLLDISSLARCFTDYGHHPLSYLVNRMSPSANSQAILLGNYAGTVLDDLIHTPETDKNTAQKPIWQTSLRKHFGEEALTYVTCPDLNNDEYKIRCMQQATNIEAIVNEIRRQAEQNDENAKFILEPSFLCPALGLQGRVDLMTADMRLLIEQKSGKNYNLERHAYGPLGVYQREDHYVQLLLYFAVLHQNFSVPISSLDIRLMYSRYPLPDGLLVMNYYQQLLNEALMVRNRIVASDMYFAREGFKPRMLHVLTPETLNEKKLSNGFYQTYILPQLKAVLDPLHNLSSLEEAYFCRMATFLFREQAVSRLGANDGNNRGMADLWNAPLDEKISTGNIIVDLKVTKATDTDIDMEYSTEGCSLNFRQGDFVSMYLYNKDGEPDITKSILYKGCIASLSANTISVHLTDRQPADTFILDEDSNMGIVIEHSSSTSGTASGLKALHMLMSAPKLRRDLLLGQRQPQSNPARQLSKSYNAKYDDVLLRVKQAEDYYLLVGPPGTGKTSMAMRFMVEEELQAGGTILLTSYTNRAIDEICEMLSSAGFDFLRIGNEYTCDSRYHNRLASKRFAEIGSLQKIRKEIEDSRIIVATTSTLMGRTELFTLKTFSLSIVDEASQILEPSIIGLLSCLGKFVLIGDHKQLPAVVQQPEEDSIVKEECLLEIGLTNCRNSLFERFINTTKLLPTQESRDAVMGTLHYQGRMHPDIAAWPNKMFYREEELQPVPLPHQLETELPYHAATQDERDEEIKKNRMLFVDVRPETVELLDRQLTREDIDSKSNINEARECADFIVRIHRLLGSKWDKVKSVGVIVPYRNQINIVRQEISALAKEQIGDDSAFEDITIDTVERYQGSQRDVIIYTFTVSHDYQLEFLTSNTFTCNGYDVDRKLNVALTRARKQLILIGNKQLLQKNSLFRSLIQYISINNQ